MKDLFSNIVDQDNLRNVQLMTLKKISETLAMTAGPYGNNTIILGDPGQGKPDTYTKDGHKVLSHIDFFNPLEKSIQTQLVEVTEHIVKTVGDGTTSTVMMCASVFEKICNYLKENEEVPVFQFVRTMDKIIEEIKEMILSHKQEFSVDSVRDICMISTNGNKEISDDIATIYQEFGKNVFITIQTSNDSENKVKAYDGLTLERGYTSPAYINSEDGVVDIRKPRLYTFTDPVDTPEMISYMEKILYENIILPFSEQNPSGYIPTVIMAPSVSRDANALLTELEKILYSVPENMKPPVLIIAGLNKQIDQYHDIVNLCGGRTINKYIDPVVQQKDIEDGKAPSIENISEWYGTCDQIICDNMKTKFINPKDMFSDEIDEDGNRKYSSAYEGLLNFLEKELEYSIKNSESVGVIGNLRRRLNSLKANMVDYLIGGISVIDRDSMKDLAEDAVLNCRSAAKNGVGYGSNFEGFRATDELYDKYDAMMYEDDERKDLYLNCVHIMYAAYEEVIYNLYALNYGGNVDSLIEDNFKQGSPVNLRTGNRDGEKVLCSIDSDITILDAIKKVIIPMATANQVLLLNPQHNKYLE
ncbi:MAG: TCP-1/cpn60 chaperonin family protein [Candidatus Izemoplasmatales bacterium]|nr:TCP-1/cpn60 chaperonin family protein [Candidatus Izemoplasmatales bacterium]